MKIPLPLGGMMALALAAGAMTCGGAHAQPTQQSHAQHAPAYYIAEFEVSDPDRLRPYSEQAEATFKAYGGRYVARRGELLPLEGRKPLSRIIIIAFDSLEKAKAWYYSPEYSAIRPIRQQSGQTNAYIVEGLAE